MCRVPATFSEQPAVRSARGRATAAIPRKRLAHRRDGQVVGECDVDLFRPRYRYGYERQSQSLRDNLDLVRHFSLARWIHHDEDPREVGNHLFDQLYPFPVESL